MKKLLVAVLVLASAVLAWELYLTRAWRADPDRPSWTPYPLAHGAFRASFPDLPSERMIGRGSGTPTAEGAQPTREGWYAARGKNNVDFYAVAMLEFDSGFFRETPAAVFDRWLPELLDGLELRLGRKGRTVLGMEDQTSPTPARTFTIEYAAGGFLMKKRLRMSARAVLEGGMLFLVSATTPDTPGNGELRQTFLDSFEVLPPPRRPN